MAAELWIIITKQHKDSSKEIQPITVASLALHYSLNTMYIKLNNHYFLFEYYAELLYKTNDLYMTKKLIN